MFLRLQMKEKGSTGFIHMAHAFNKNRMIIEWNLVYFHQFSRLFSRNLVWSKFSSSASCGFCKKANSTAAASGRVSCWEFGLRLSNGGRSERSFLRLWSERKRRPSAKARQGLSARPARPIGVSGPGAGEPGRRGRCSHPGRAGLRASRPPARMGEETTGKAAHLPQRFGRSGDLAHQPGRCAWETPIFLWARANYLPVLVGGFLIILPTSPLPPPSTFLLD